MSLIKLPKHYKETSIAKPNSIGNGLTNAAKTATNYIHADSNGIKIANANPATATTYQHQTATETEFVVDNVSKTKIGSDEIRLGEAGQNLTLTPASLSMTSDNVNVMNIVSSGASELASWRSVKFANGANIDISVFTTTGEEKSATTYTYLTDTTFPSISRFIVNFSNYGGTNSYSTSIIIDPNVDYTETLNPKDDDTFTITWTASTKLYKVSYNVTSDHANYRMYCREYEYRSNECNPAFTLGTREDGSALGAYSFALGYELKATDDCAHAEGFGSRAQAKYSHAEGNGTGANGESSHSEGVASWTSAAGIGAHAEGYNSSATGRSAHAEGYYSHATGSDSHAEGLWGYAAGPVSHVEGSHCYANSENAHAGGESSQVVAMNAFAHGFGCFAYGNNQMVIGSANAVDFSKQFAFIIGNGSTFDEDADPETDPDRSNALTVDWNGFIEAANVHNIITVSPANEVNATGDTFKIPVKQLYKVGNGFEVVNGYVKCLLDGYISVEGMQSYSGFNNGNVLQVIVYRCNTASDITKTLDAITDKDSAQYHTIRGYDTSSSTRACLVVPRRIFAVTAGSFICIAGGNTSGSTGKSLASGNRNYFTLEYV